MAKNTIKNVTVGRDVVQAGTLTQYITNEVFEQSIVADIIAQLVDTSIEIHETTHQVEAYSIDEKIKYNNFCQIYAKRIKNEYTKYYQPINGVLRALEKDNVAVREDLRYQYEVFYVEALLTHGIKDENDQQIILMADNLYQSIVHKAEMKYSKVQGARIETITKYIHAITAYMFCECAILLPVPSEKE